MKNTIVRGFYFFQGKKKSVDMSVINICRQQDIQTYCDDVSTTLHAKDTRKRSR